MRYAFITLLVVATVSGCADADQQQIANGLWTQPGEGGTPRVAYQRDEKYGFLDAKGRVAIKPTYRWAVDFKGGFALCSVGGRGTIIDETGSIVGQIPVGAGTYHRADTDRFWFQVDQKWGLCDQSGMVITPPSYDDVGTFSHSLARVNIGAELEFPGFMEGGKTGYIDRDGKTVIPIQFAGWGWEYHNGYAVVGDKLINREGNVVYSSFGLGRFFSDGLIPVCDFKDPATTRYVDATGTTKFKVDGYGEEFSQGLAAVSHNKRTGYIDTSGNDAIKPRFLRAEIFSNGLAGVQVAKGRWGYINRNGELVTPTHFNDLRPAEKEFAIVHYGGSQHTAEDGPIWWEDGRWLMIDRTGQVLAVVRKDKPQF